MKTRFGFRDLYILGAVMFIAGADVRTLTGGVIALLYAIIGAVVYALAWSAGDEAAARLGRWIDAHWDSDGIHALARKTRREAGR